MVVNWSTCPVQPFSETPAGQMSLQANPAGSFRKSRNRRESPDEAHVLTAVSLDSPITGALDLAAADSQNLDVAPGV